MTGEIWHNPRCSKSRETLKLIQDAGHDPRIRLYVQDAPTEGEITKALAALGLRAHDLLRRGDAKALGLSLGPDSPEAEIIAAMVRHPKLIERPVVIVGDQARLGRPPGAVLDLFD